MESNISSEFSANRSLENIMRGEASQGFRFGGEGHFRSCAKPELAVAVRGPYRAWGYISLTLLFYFHD